ncbi:MAG: hypothetical protein JXR16_01250 [Bermanella sp.]
MKWFLNKFGMDILGIKIDALSERERRLVFLVSNLLVISVFIYFVWHPLYKSSLDDYRVALELENNTVLIKKEINELKRLSGIDINYPYINKIINLEKELVGQVGEIGSLTSDLMTPERISDAFGEILSTKKMIINNMNNNPAEPILLDGESASFLFKHELVMNMNSKYLDSIGYVKKLEGQEWKIYWDEMDFTIIEYPVGVLTMKVHTLSNSDRLIGL